MSAGTSVNRCLAAFVTSAEPPADAVAAASRAFVDTMAVMLAGVREPAAKLVRAMVIEESPSGAARIVGTSQRTSPGGAALANGTAAHALDFDDVSFVSLGHPSATLVPAALAAGELAGASGRTLLDAYCIGYDVQGRVGRAMNPSHYQRGWHCTSTIGALGAAAAAARAMRLDADRAAHALALAASHASGLKANFGTMTKPLHAGLAARGGVHAAMLAARGFTASDAALDGDQGFAVAFDGREKNLESSLARLGQRWELLEDGPNVKVYPSCAGTHPTIDALLDLRRRAGFSASDVESIEAGVDEVTPTILLYDRPRTGLEGKFSLHYCAAAAVIDGRVDLDSFEDAHVAASSYQGFLPRVTMRVDRSLDAAAPRLTQVALTIRLADGRTLRDRRTGAKGHADRPVTSAELADKFRSCAQRVLPATAVDRALAALERLDALPDASALTGILTGS
jgi:2-methylcitrate dehydratase PrpD